MKQIYKWLSFLLIGAFFISSCSKFEEMNVNPNEPADVPTSALLTQAQYNLVDNLNGELAQLGAQYVQYFAQLDYPYKSYYAEDGVSSFSVIYRGGLNDLNEIIKLNEDELTRDDKKKYGDIENQIAVAKILTAWAFQNVTDIWGDIPYSEALKEDIILPKFDTQESIYDDLIVQLNAAQSMINLSPDVELKGDMIFDGDMSMWDAFAESLKIRIAMRLSEVDDTKAGNLIANADFNKAFSNSSHYAHFSHLATESEANPLYIDNFVAVGGDYFACANTIIDALIAVNDPRVATYANLSANGGTYVGHPYGEDITGTDADVSMPGDMYGGQTAPSILMTAAEILLIKAEAIQRGYIAGDAAQTYNDAITASMEYNGINAGAITTYLAQPEIQYNATNWRQLIGTQKWFALFNQGIQAWAEFRRLDEPALAVAPAATIGVIPTRRAYSTEEYSTNNKNVTEAVARLATGEDVYTEKVWWDK